MLLPDGVEVCPLVIVALLIVQQREHPAGAPGVRVTSAQPVKPLIQQLMCKSQIWELPENTVLLAIHTQLARAQAAIILHGGA